ncbi:hypothetical protein BH10BAC2_BH10BAC2_44630 [soil metagenome]
MLWYLHMLKNDLNVQVCDATKVAVAQLMLVKTMQFKVFEICLNEFKTKLDIK